MKKNALELYLFIGLISIFPIIDFLNGFFISNGIHLPIGESYRILCFGYLLIGILYKGFHKNSYTLLVFLFLASSVFLLLVQAIVLQNTLPIVIKDAAVFIKFSLWVLIPYFIYQRKTAFLSINYEHIFIAISIFFTLALLLPYFLGIGNQTYENSDAGYKGFFFATNDTTIAFMISATFTGWVFVQSLSKSRLLKLLLLASLYFSNMICLLLVSTKTGIIYGVLLTIGLLLYFLIYQKQVRLAYRITFFFLAVILLVAFTIGGSSFIVSAVSGTYTRITYFYQLYNGDLVQLLSSSRSEFLKGGFAYFADNHNNVLIPLIGFGFEYRLLHFGRIGLVEMDFFDGLFALGFIGVLMTSLIIAYFLYLSMKKINRSIYTLTYCVFLLYSFSAGHVMFSALSSTLLGLVCGGIILTQESRKQK